MVISLKIRVEQVILSATCLLCGLLWWESARDPALTLRNLMLCISTILLVFIIAKSRIDISILKRAIFPIYTGFVILTVLSVINAINISETLYESLRVFMFGILFVAIALIGDKDVIIKSLCVLGLLLGIWGAVQCVFLVISAGKIVPNLYAGTMCNKNLWASAFMLLIPFSVYTISYKGIWRNLGIIACATGALNLFMIMSRSAVLGIIAAAITACFFNKKFLIVVLIIGLLLGIYVYCYSWSLLTGTTSTQVRLGAWEQTLKIIKSMPLTGVGAGNWQIEMLKYNRFIKNVPNLSVNKFFRQPHNDFLWVTAEIGWAGIAFYLALFLITIFYCIKTRNILVISALAAYVVNACFSFPRERAFHSFILIVLFALAVRGYHKGKAVYKNIIPVSVVVLIVLSFTLVNFVYRHRTSAMMRRLGKAHSSVHAVDILKYSPFATLDNGVPIHWYIGYAHYLLGDIPMATDRFEKAYKHNPYSVSVLNGLGMCYAATDGFEAGKEYLEEAIDMCPVTVDAVDNLLVYNKRGTLCR